MNAMTLSGVALAALCMLGCERNDRLDGEDATKPKLEPKTDRAVPADKAETPSRAPENAKAPELGLDAPGAARSPYDEPKDDPSAQGPTTREEYIAASRRRLDDMERELQQLETRGKERGKELRREIREEKRKLDADLARMSEETDEAWTKMKGGFADALERLEGQIHQVRKDIDPDA